MKFDDAVSILNTIIAGDEVARIQGVNRARINNLFNGAPPLDEEDAQNMRMEINVNFGEAPVLGQQGRRQYNNAFLSRGTFFKINIPDAPTEKRADWSAFITRKINRYLKRSRTYYELQRSQWASTLLHGMAPKLWYDSWEPIPRYVALSDFRVPTDSLCSMENVTWFAVRKYYTPGELMRKVWGKNADEGWQKPAVQKILDLYTKEMTVQNNQNYWLDQPEKMVEAWKQNGGFYASDAVPTIPLWHFFFMDDDDPRRSCWKMRVVPDQNIIGAPNNDFVFDNGDKAWAQKLDHILHVQFGDLNNDAPFKIHSVRSLGFLLMEPIFWSNTTQCRALQHLFEHMNAWLKIMDPSGRARAQKIDLFHKAILEEGVDVVPQNSRHQIDVQLLQHMQANLEGLKNQASVSYTQETQGVENETATGVMARVSSVNALMSGLISTAANYETYANEEICRRFCLSRSPSEDVRRFQKECLEFGIERRFINVEMWDVIPETPIGDGNPTMEMAKAKQLLEMRPLYDGTAQQEILHEATVAFADERRADKWVPLGKTRGVTDAQEHAELAFSTLMLGVPVRVREGLSRMEQIETMLGLLAGVIARIEQTGGMARPDEIQGLMNAANYTSQLIQQLGMDKAEKPKAKEYGDVLGKLMNSVKGFMQRLQEQQKSAMANGANGENGQTAAKIQSQLILAKSKAQIAESKNAQTQAHKQIAFENDQRRQDAKTFKEIERETAKQVNETEPTETTTR